MPLLPGMSISVRWNPTELLGGRVCVVRIFMVLQNCPTALLQVTELLSHEDLNIIYFLYISKLHPGRYALSGTTYFSIGTESVQRINMFD